MDRLSKRRDATKGARAASASGVASLFPGVPRLAGTRLLPLSRQANRGHGKCSTFDARLETRDGIAR